MYTFTLSGRESVLSAKIYPPIILDPEKSYALGLIDFVTFNTIPNVDETNNKFFINNADPIVIPVGSYEIDDIQRVIMNKIQEKQKELKEKQDKSTQMRGTSTNAIQKEIDSSDGGIHLSMNVNRNTLRFEIMSNKVIHFEKKSSIAPLLGFTPRRLSRGKLHISDFPINISKVNAICVECNLIKNSYNNNEAVHVLHMFHPNVPSGYRIVEKVSNVIYLPVNTNHIDEIVLKIVDQDGKLVNFNQEVVTIRVHLKEV
nr:unnamed protein product [Callosobruchus analis]